MRAGRSQHWLVGTKRQVTLNITGVVTIVGNQSDLTVIDANELDRAFKIHPGGSLNLSRVTVTGGLSPVDQGGGGILSAGNLSLQDSIIRGNSALALPGSDPIRGGGVAVWDGNADITRSWIDENESEFGGGIFYCGDGSGTVSQSTVSNNDGGGLHSHSDSGLNIENSTFSANAGGQGAHFQRQERWNSCSSDIDDFCLPGDDRVDQQ